MMRLVFLYGPPAVGKLSVARELAARTGFKLFHNHLTIDLVTSVFPFGSEPYKQLVHRFRRDLIAESAREGVDLIFTFVYSAHEDDDLVRELIEPVQSRGGTVLFVRLSCATPELFVRVQNESRRAHGKLTDPTELRAALGRYNFSEAVPFGETLEIDTTHQLPAEAAGRIVEHYSLPTVTIH
jgi:chloramphenicol 3-O-phosphotransferase